MDLAKNNTVIVNIKLLISATVLGLLSCSLTSVELPHHSKLKVLAVVPWVVQVKYSGS